MPQASQDQDQGTVRFTGSKEGQPRLASSPLLSSILSHPSLQLLPLYSMYLIILSPLRFFRTLSFWSLVIPHCISWVGYHGVLVVVIISCQYHGV